MRLTLRTLLAYLDDILEPDQAKEIGAKIQESSLATALVDRVREVMRRRRLTAPQVGGPGDIDANLVAEYLDNTLPPDAVADVERICLDSDVHLAEVAASHQILTLVLGEPVEIVPRSRERMYALGPTAPPPTPAATTAPATPAQAAHPPAAASAATPAKPAAATFDETIPDYLKHRPWTSRVLPYVAVVAIFIWIGLILRDPSLWPFARHKSQDDLARTQRQNAAAPVAPVPAGPPEAAAPTQPGEPVLAQNEPAKVEKPLDVDAQPPADEPEETPATPKAKNPPAEEPAPEPVEKPKKEVAVAPAKPAAQVAPAPAAAVEVPPLQYVSADGILMRHDRTDGNWYVMPRRALLHPDEVVAVPEPFQAQLELGTARYPVSIDGGTSARVLGPSPFGPLGFAVYRGRIVVRGKRPAGVAPEVGDKTCALSLRLGSEAWRLELLSEDAVCGIQITPRQPDGFEQDFGQDTYTGAVYVAKGSVRLTDEADKAQTVDSPGWIPLSPSVRLAPAPEAESPPAPAFPGLPNWLTDAKTPAHQYAKLFEKEFDAQDPVAVSLTNTVADRRFEISRLAVACLSVMEDHAALVEVLDRGEHEESRIEAIQGLRTWINLRPENRETLKATLAKQFHEDQADAIYHLLWGYSEKDARDADTSLKLVNWMNDESLAIRELAFFYVHKLTGKRYDYRPNLAPLLRKTAIGHWLKHLDKDGALLPQAPKEKEAAAGRTNLRAAGKL